MSNENVSLVKLLLRGSALASAVPAFHRLVTTAVSPTQVAVEPHPPKRKHKFWLWLIGFVVVVALLFVGYIATVLSVAYSSGQRTGYVQKLSHKGWLCKTCRGRARDDAHPGNGASDLPLLGA